MSRAEGHRTSMGLERLLIKLNLEFDNFFGKYNQKNIRTLPFKNPLFYLKI